MNTFTLTKKPETPPELTKLWDIADADTASPRIVTASGDTVLESSEWLIADPLTLDHIVELHNKSLQS